MLAAGRMSAPSVGSTISWALRLGNRIAPKTTGSGQRPRREGLSRAGGEERITSECLSCLLLFLRRIINYPPLLAHHCSHGNYIHSLYFKSYILCVLIWNFVFTLIGHFNNIHSSTESWGKIHKALQVSDSRALLRWDLVMALSWRVTPAYVGRSLCLCSSRD